MSNHKKSVYFKIRVILLEAIVILLSIIVINAITKIKEHRKVYNKDNPYIISCTEDMIDFANMVGDGYSFKDEYVLMTDDIDLTDVWLPYMGVRDSGHYFEGTFDGGGHVIYNIYIGKDEGDNSIFGSLAGTVMNLGIEPGVIQGGYCGSIADHSVSPYARIINCYNKALLYGHYTGGIATYFDGTIVNCLSMCEMQSRVGSGNIFCFGDGESINCFSIHNDGRGDTHNTKATYVKFFVDGDKYTSFSQITPIVRDELNSGIAKILTRECPDIPVEDYSMWEISEDGQTIGFSGERVSPSIIDRMIYMLYRYHPLSTVCIALFICVNVLLLTGGVGRINFMSERHKSDS